MNNLNQSNLASRYDIPWQDNGTGKAAAGTQIASRAAAGPSAGALLDTIFRKKKRDL